MISGMPKLLVSILVLAPLKFQISFQYSWNFVFSSVTSMASEVCEQKTMGKWLTWRGPLDMWHNVRVQRSHDTSGISEVMLQKICWVNSVHFCKSSLPHIRNTDHWTPHATSGTCWSTTRPQEKCLLQIQLPVQIIGWIFAHVSRSRLTCVIPVNLVHNSASTGHCTGQTYSWNVISNLFLFYVAKQCGELDDFMFVFRDCFPACWFKVQNKEILKFLARMKSLTCKRSHWEI